MRETYIAEKTDRILYKGKDYELYGVNDINEEHRFIKVWGKHLCR